MSENPPDPRLPHDAFTVVPPSPPYQVNPATNSVVRQIEASFHQGPLPPARELAAYEQAHPGAAAWILREAEANAVHIRAMENKGALIQTRDALLFRVFPFLIVLTYLVGTILIAIFANAWLGGTLLATGLVSVSTVYLKGVMPGSGPNDESPSGPK